MASCLLTQTQVTNHIYQVLGSAVNAAYAAHNGHTRTSLHRPVPVENTEFPPQQLVENPVEGPSGREEEGQSPATYPKFDRLAYKSIEQIQEDWFGEGNSAYAGHGGIKTLYNNKLWRQSLGTDAIKREANKKMLQKMKRIGEYMEKKRLEGKPTEEVAASLRQRLSNNPKLKETLTGIDKLLKIDNI